MQSIVLLSGPVGAGKTTVAPALVASAPGPVAYIEGDAFWSFIAKDGKKQGWQKNFGIIMRAMMAAAIPFAIGDYEVVLDFSIPPWFLDTARRIATRRAVPLDYVVLRPSEAVCAARAAARLAGPIADYQPYRELYRSFDEAASHIVADDASDASVIANHIRHGLAAGTFRLPT